MKLQNFPSMLTTILVFLHLPYLIQTNGNFIVKSLNRSRSSRDYLNYFTTRRIRSAQLWTHGLSQPLDDGTPKPLYTPVEEPVVHSNMAPEVVNPFSSDNIHIIKKFYSLPVIQTVPKPIPVTVSKSIPYPIHHNMYQYVPQPYPQPVSKPDVHLSFIHLTNRANPCKHGGIIVQSTGGYACLCRRAYKGKHCQERDHCYPHPCENNGNCIDLGSQYKCRCPAGFKGIHCEVADKCHNHPCKNEAKCVQLLSNVKCVCAQGYKGKYCEDIDYCQPNPCRNDGKCEEINLAPSCKCTAGFKGQRCQVPKTCTVNICRNGATCVEDTPSQPCSCAAGFSGKYCTENICLPNPCQHGGRCYPMKNDMNNTWYATCVCNDLYKGDLCQVSNPCASNPSPCVHGICYDEYRNIAEVAIPPAGYMCHCYEGYFGVNCQSRKCDHCDKNARCLDGVRCTCNEGYLGDGQDCHKMPNPCKPNPCMNEGLCKALWDTFECSCVPGFKGRICQQKTPCSAVVNPCENGGTCIETKNNFRCLCKSGFKGKNCSETANMLCNVNHCLNGGTCRVSEDGNSWYCICQGSHFKPPDCACNCPANAHDVNQRNLTCNNPQGVCECPLAFHHHKGLDVCISDETTTVIGGSFKACDPSPCKNGATCVRLTSSKELCQCSRGWKGKYCDTKAPIETNSSCVPNPCENGGTCSNVTGSVVCACAEGFLPPLCELQGKTVCSPNPCKNNGRCVKAEESYDCICKQRFTGPNCEVDRCAKCDPINAVCNEAGLCSCKPGFTGNGYLCALQKITPSRKVNICVAKCHPDGGVCVDNSCYCRTGYVGNGYQCTATTPGTIHYASNYPQMSWFKRDNLL